MVGWKLVCGMTNHDCTAWTYDTFGLYWNKVLLLLLLRLLLLLLLLLLQLLYLLLQLLLQLLWRLLFHGSVMA